VLTYNQDSAVGIHWHPDWFWDPSSLLFSWYTKFFPHL